jgi:hypothetical protein
LPIAGGWRLLPALVPAGLLGRSRHLDHRADGIIRDPAPRLPRTRRRRQRLPLPSPRSSGNPTSLHCLCSNVAARGLIGGAG